MLTPVLFEGFVLFQDRLVFHITALRYKGYLIDMSHNIFKKSMNQASYMRLPIV